MTRRLMVNLGVRYSYFGQPYDNNNQLTNFNPGIFSTPNVQTIDSNGQLCTTAGQTTAVTTFTSTGVTTTYTLNNCLNVNGLNTYQPNTAADPLNGIILGSPDLIKQVNFASRRIRSSSRRARPRSRAMPLRSTRKWARRRSMTGPRGWALRTTSSATAKLRCAAAMASPMTTRR